MHSVLWAQLLKNALDRNHRAPLHQGMSPSIGFRNSCPIEYGQTILSAEFENYEKG